MKKTGNNPNKASNAPRGIRNGGLGFSLPSSGKEAFKHMKKEGSVADTVRTPLEFFDPAYFDPILFFIQHKDRKELNYRLRYFYEFSPIVHNIIDLHSTYPLSDFELTPKTTHRSNFWNDYKENMELLPYLTDVGKEWWLLGEVCASGDWDDANALWHRWKLYPPERIEVRGTYVSDEPLLYLSVDAKLKDLVKSGDPIDQKIVQMMSPTTVEQIKSGNSIFLEPFSTKFLSRKTSRYDLRGTSIVKSCLKDLLAIEKLRLLQFTYIDRHYSPLKIFKLGDRALGWVPSRAHFENLRNLLIQAANDPSFTLIHHFGLEVDYVGTKDKIQNLIPEFEFATKNVLAGLFGSQALLLGEGATFSNASIGLRVLSQRYATFRDMITLFVRNKILSPIARKRDWYVSDTTGASGQEQVNINGKYRVLDIPAVKWHKLNLLDDTAQKNLLMRLREKQEISLKTMWELMDRDPETELQRLKEEEGTPSDPLYQKARGSKIDEAPVAKQILKGVKGPVLDLAPPEPEIEDISSDKPKNPAGGGTANVPTSTETPSLLSETETGPEAVPPLGDGPADSGPDVPPLDS